MVAKRDRRAAAVTAAFCLSLVFLLLWAFPLVDRATGAGEPTITEEYTVTVNAVGDARIVDTITYTEEDFEYVKNVEADRRGFLTRRFETEDNRGELVDFDVQFDEDENSVVITYNRPGFAYYTDGEWVVFGLPGSKPDGGKDLSYAFEEQSTVNNEFTLFTDQEILTTTTIELPAEATDHRYDGEDRAIRYSMPAAGSTMGFWSDNRTTMTVVFGLSTLLFAGLLVLVLMRRPAAPATATAASTAPGEPARPLAPVEAAAPPAAAYSPAPPAPLATEAPAAPLPAGFCGKCGKPVAEGKRFCPYCGATR